MNKHSSRSHCIFTVTVQFVRKTKNDTVQCLGKLHMVDLAGSECAKNASLDSRQTKVRIDSLDKLYFFHLVFILMNYFLSVVIRLVVLVKEKD